MEFHWCPDLVLIGFSTNLYEEIKEGKKMWVAVTQRDSRDVH